MGDEAELRLECADDAVTNSLRLGHGGDVRFVFVALGGGAIRIGREIARRRLRHLETVAINCDPSVHDLEEFDRRVLLGPERGDRWDTGGSPVVGGHLARAAEPVLAKVFEGATFLTVLSSLGGGTGTGALPFVLDAAARSSEVLTAFVVKPFACEGERRAVGDRALARLHFVEAFVEKRELGYAALHVLDNETVARAGGRRSLASLTHHWAGVVSEFIEHEYLAPVEAMLEAHRLARIAEQSRAEPAGGPIRPPFERTPEPGLVPPVPVLNPPLAPLPAGALASDVELTFEIEAMPRPPTLL